MITAVLAFLSSSAGGAFTGFLLEAFGWRSKQKEADRQFSHEKDLAYHNQLTEHNKGLDRASKAKTYPKKFKIKIWGFEYETTRYYQLFTPRSRVVAHCLWMLGGTFCAVILLWAANPSATIHTFDPSAGDHPTRIGIPWLFMAEFFRDNIYVLNTGGAVYGMLISINFILTTAIVGGVRRTLR